jgi:hypothetical protein
MAARNPKYQKYWEQLDRDRAAAAAKRAGRPVEATKPAAISSSARQKSVRVSSASGGGSTPLGTDRFNQLLALGRPVASSEPGGSTAPGAIEFGAAAETLARAHGPIALHSARPSDTELAAAQQTVARAQTARDQEAAARKAASAVLAAKILAAGKGRHTIK